MSRVNNKGRRITVVLLLGALLLVTGSPLSAFFEDLGRDARARGMANSIIALYGNVHSMQYNPAGTAHAKNLELNLIWGKPITMGELNDGTSFTGINGTILMPFTNGVNTSWLIRWLFHALTFGNEAFMFKDGAMGVSFDYRDNAGLATETMITLNYAKILDDVLFKGAKLSAGVNFDFYLLGITKTEDASVNPYIKDYSKLSFGMDLGFIYNFSDTLTLAVVFENLVKPNFSVTGSEDYSPMNVKFGGSIYFNKLLFFEDLTINAMYVTYGKYDPMDNTVSKTSYHFGFESWWFKRHFGFRGGLMLGDDENSELSTGVTMLLPLGDHFLSVDYAFTLPFGVEGYRHILALTWKWEQPKYRFEYDKKKAAEMRRIAELEAKQRQQAAGGGSDTKGDDKKSDDKKVDDLKKTK